jgi:hypothetical protein
MTTSNTPEDTELLKAVKKCFTDNDMTEDGYTDYEDIELFDTDKVISDLMNLITLHTNKKDIQTLNFAKEKVNELRDIYLTQENMLDGSDPLANKAVAIRNHLRQEITADIDERIATLSKPIDGGE